MTGLRKPRKPGSLVATTLLSLVALAYLFFIFLPKQEDISQRRRELDQKRKFLVATDQLVHRIKSANEELTMARRYTQDWESRSPSAATLADVYEQLSTSALEAGVSMTKFDPQPIEKMNRICQLPIHLAAEGDFEQIVKLLQRLETLGTTIRVDSLSLEPLAQHAGQNYTRRSEGPGKSGDANSGSSSVQCQITMNVFADKSKFSD